MNSSDREHRLTALAVRSSYIENVLRHNLVASLSSAVWQHDPFASLQVFNSEVDDSGFDLVLGLGLKVRYVQLKQAHEDKVPSHCSLRLSFSKMHGSCVILMSYSVATLQLTSFRFFGSASPSEAMPIIEELSPSKSPGRRNAAGERKVRTNYRDVPVRRRFQGPLSVEELLHALFPSQSAA
jgi:hypothetical protein